MLSGSAYALPVFHILDKDMKTGGSLCITKIKMQFTEYGCVFL